MNTTYASTYLGPVMAFYPPQLWITLLGEHTHWEEGQLGHLTQTLVEASRKAFQNLQQPQRTKGWAWLFGYKVKSLEPECRFTDGQ